VSASCPLIKVIVMAMLILDCGRCPERQ